MIRFTLLCDDGHEFDGWFRSNDDFDAQAASGLVACPICGGAQVRKALMRPAVVGTKREARAAAPGPEDRVPVALGGPDDEGLARLQALAREVRSKAEHVGRRFAREARDIHDGVTPERAIYGEASPDEIRGLVEDGIPVAPLPPLPEDQN